jgi:gamma-glutamyltranspeptidase/glutathione hydrolase
MMGHTVKALDGESVGGFQAILFTPDPVAPSSDVGHAGDTLHGFYRAGSDFRKDGEAVGW